MNDFLSSNNFPSKTRDAGEALKVSLEAILQNDYKTSLFALFGKYREILSDNRKKGQWDEINGRLMTLFKCGTYAPLDGPMIGVSVSIRDSDYFRSTAEFFGKERSAIANIEWMAGCWNATFANTGIWMGKTFEPVAEQTVAEKCGNNSQEMTAYDRRMTRIGRNFFRQPHNPGLLQLAGIPALTSLWNLKDRPLSPDAGGFEGELLPVNLEKEKHIPYIKTGGLFLANPGKSVVPEINGKDVYQLNYRWPGLDPVYPMTRLVDELVQVDKGIYLGQLVMATKHYSLGSLKLSFLPGDHEHEIGEPYRPARRSGGSPASLLPSLFNDDDTGDYGYQNNGFFLMIDPAYAREAYADNAFPLLRPHPGEMGYKELGYDKETATYGTAATGSLAAKDSKLSRIQDWISGWRENQELHRKFTTFCLEPSSKESDSGDVRDMLAEGESILQMLKRIQAEISRQTNYDDQLEHFEKLNRLFRSGVAPKVAGGLFQGVGKGFNTRFDGLEDREWYGGKEPCTGFDYYHGATLNLHCGFSDTFQPDLSRLTDESHLFPTTIASLLKENRDHPNLLDIMWASIGRYIFPWAGKSFERISARKLSMLLDESDDLKKRYPGRVRELKTFPASWPHYDLVLKNEKHYWQQQGPYAEHLKSGSWDNGMSDEDREFWQQETDNRWVFGMNLQDSRILAADTVMRMLDMNYQAPDKALLDLAEAGPTPFVRQGYMFLGTADRQSILPMNNGIDKKRVFQFHYRYPLIGGPVPIGTCLDEIVEIAEGLFLGQLIYSTLPFVPFHSSVEPSDYKYQLFGYFLLLDNDWQYHRQAIKLDTLT